MIRRIFCYLVWVFIIFLIIKKLCYIIFKWGEYKKVITKGRVNYIFYLKNHSRKIKL